jgi:hypothetical protein
MIQFFNLSVVALGLARRADFVISVVSAFWAFSAYFNSPRAVE